MDRSGRNALHTVSPRYTLPDLNGLSDGRKWDAAVPIIERAIETRQMAVVLQNPLEDRTDLLRRPRGHNSGGEIDMDFKGRTRRTRAQFAHPLGWHSR
jgi:hypothetical protein